jgi:hypothetical protein
MLFGGHDSDFLAKVSERLQNLPFSRKSLKSCLDLSFITVHNC